MLNEAYPQLDVDVRPWGRPLHSLGNLRAYERNLKTAQILADELTPFRRENPKAIIDIVGVSGGGAMALFVLQALPEDVTINRLILIAPAISFDYPVESTVMPHVSEFVINFASPMDLQVGWGTRLFGTMDRRNVKSAGYSGFASEHPNLLQIRWNKSMIRQGHRGNHLGYYSSAWLRKYVLPALDPQADMEHLQKILGSN